MHGRVTCQSNQHVVDSTCTVDCDHGALHKDTTVIRCQEDFTWTELPKCRPPPCSPENNTTGEVSCTSSGHRCFRNCGQGRLSRMTTCQQDGFWDYKFERLSCEPASSSLRITLLHHVIRKDWRRHVWLRARWNWHWNNICYRYFLMFVIMMTIRIIMVNFLFCSRGNVIFIRDKYRSCRH